MDDTANIQTLHELISALDRRLPQVERSGEAAMAQDAANLKAKALEQIADLEQKSSSAESP